MKKIILAATMLVTTGVFATDIENLSWNSLSGSPAFAHTGAYIYRMGDTVCLAFRGNEQGRQYSGTVTVEGGSILSFSEGFDDRNDSAWRRSNDSIAFNFETFNGTDRLTFKAAGEGSILVKLKANGKPLDGLVKIGDGLSAARSEDGYFRINLPEASPEPVVIAPTVVHPTVVSPTVVRPTVVHPTIVRPTVVRPPIVRPVVTPKPIVVRPRVVRPVRVIRHR